MSHSGPRQCLEKMNAKYVIKRLWHEIFHIVPGINPRPISALQLCCRAWYGSLGLIPGPIWKRSCNNLLLSPSAIDSFWLSVWIFWTFFPDLQWWVFKFAFPTTMYLCLTITEEIKYRNEHLVHYINICLYSMFIKTNQYNVVIYFTQNN